MFDSIVERGQNEAEDPADDLCPDEFGCKRVMSVATMLMWGVGDTFPLGLCERK